MNISELSIRRPVLSTVLTLIILLFGLIGYSYLGVREYPSVDNPIISVSCSYPGANADVIENQITEPLEQNINGIPGIRSLSSVSQQGSSRITVEFELSVDLETAANDVRDKVSRAQRYLPRDCDPPTVSKADADATPILMVALQSDKRSLLELSEIADLTVKEQLQTISDVSSVSIWGEKRYSMRLWLDPIKMSGYGITPIDVKNAVDKENVELPSGSIEGNTVELTIRTLGLMHTAEEFNNLILREDNNRIIRFSDIGRAELGPADIKSYMKMNGVPMVGIVVVPQPGANHIKIADAVYERMEQMQKDLPDDVQYSYGFDNTKFIRASISEVKETVYVAFILVIIIIFLFLRDWRVTLVPCIVIPVSLIGAFFVMYLAGFSINVLSMLAVVLAVGLVVDDAIVVVEAVQARFDVGYRSSYMASIDAMKGISNAVITSSLVFMAVFIPVSFMSGTSGTFYTQFGLTMAVAVGISAINALTLSPALCALLLRPYINEDGTQKNNFAARFRNSFNAAFDVVVNKYKNAVLFFIKRRWLSWSLLACSVVLLVLLMNSTKTSLVPDEDQGVLFVNVSTAPGSSLKTTDDVMLRIEERLEAIPQKLHIQKVAGYGLLSGQGNTFGMIVMKLKPWDERTKKEDQVQAVIGQIYARTADIKDATIFAIAPGMIPGYGMGNALDLNVQDKLGTDVNTFFQTTQQYLGALNQRPEISMAYSTFDVRYPQWTVEVDAAKCKRAGITPDAVLSTLSGYYGGQYVSNFNRFSKVYRVMIQSGPEYRMDESSLHNTFVRMANGEMAPLSQFVTLTRSYGAETLSRFNMYNSISVNAMPAEGYSTGDAIRAVKETAEISLPKGYGYDFGGITREENQQSGTTVIIFGICILMIYLILSALYESFIVPFAVILAVPVGLMGTFLFAKIAGLENNIYLQTGLIMLIGLLAKTAILLTEYAAERRKAGMGLIASAVSAAKARLRPILMTALTMIFGLFPLVVATGVGANGNRSLGTGVVGGMTIGTLALLFIVPALFVTFQWLQERLRPAQSMPTKDWQIEEEMEVSKKEIEESHK